MVRGRVQGVGFRYHVVERAGEAGLAGWVRNRPDGSLECLAEGREADLEALLELLRRGPPGSGVSHLEQEWLPAGGDLSGFRVLGWP